MRIVCLVKRADLNGQLVELVTEARGGRWACRLPRGSSSLSVKASNLAKVKFGLVSIVNQGLGLVALAKIERGERVLAETPLLKGAHPFAMVSLVDTLLTTEGAREFWKLHDCRASPSKSALGVLTTNCFSLGENGSEGCGLFVVGSRFNHSCLPNTDRTWDTEAGALIIHAARDIEAGEELTIYYKSISKPRDTRRAELELAFNFACRCATCGLSGDALRESDARRVEYAALDDRLLLMAHTPLDGIKVVYRLLQIIKLEFDDAPSTLHRTYYDGVTMALYAQKLDLAAAYMRKAFDTTVLAEGPDSAQARSYERLARDIRAHPRFAQISQEAAMMGRMRL